MRGHTLLELTFVVLLIGIATSAAVPSAGRLRDRGAVVGAREAVVGLLSEARLAAVETGRATMRITAAPATIEVTSARGPVEFLALGTDFGVTVELSGGRREVDLAFDGLGLGRVTSQTVVFRRDRAVSQLVVSSYGRVRRR